MGGGGGISRFCGFGRDLGNGVSVELKSLPPPPQVQPLLGTSRTFSLLPFLLMAPLSQGPKNVNYLSLNAESFLGEHSCPFRFPTLVLFLGGHIFFKIANPLGKIEGILRSKSQGILVGVAFVETGCYHEKWNCFAMILIAYRSHYYVLCND